MKIQYINKQFRPASLQIIKQANDIIKEYQDQGYTLTVRQLYYQFVANDLISNSQKSYIKIKDTISNGRLAGLIDWEAIEDRTRNLERNSHWGSPKDAILSAGHWFALDKWLNQNVYIEVWIEKEALTGVIEPICTKLDVPYFACRGYSSQSESWRAGNRMLKAMTEEREPIILHLGDHDPSGIDMTRDNQERIDLFTQEDGVPGSIPVTVNRIALNMDQIKKYNPPPNPAKETDSRFSKYIKRFGGKSWELDALSPSMISSLIETEVHKHIDQDKWEETLEQEQKYKDQLKNIAYNLEY